MTMNVLLREHTTIKHDSANIYTFLRCVPQKEAQWVPQDSWLTVETCFSFFFLCWTHDSMFPASWSVFWACQRHLTQMLYEWHFTDGRILCFTINWKKNSIFDQMYQDLINMVQDLIKISPRFDSFFFQDLMGHFHQILRFDIKSQDLIITF